MHVVENLENMKNLVNNKMMHTSISSILTVFIIPFSSLLAAFIAVICKAKDTSAQVYQTKNLVGNLNERHFNIQFVEHL